MYLSWRFFFKKVFSLYLFWRLEQSEQRHLCVDIFLMSFYIFNLALTGIRQKTPNSKPRQINQLCSTTCWLLIVCVDFYALDNARAYDKQTKPFPRALPEALPRKSFLNKVNKNVLRSVISLGQLSLIVIYLVILAYSNSKEELLTKSADRDMILASEMFSKCVQCTWKRHTVRICQVLSAFIRAALAERDQLMNSPPFWLLSSWTRFVVCYFDKYLLSSIEK